MIVPPPRTRLKLLLANPVVEPNRFGRSDWVDTELLLDVVEVVCETDHRFERELFVDIDHLGLPDVQGNQCGLVLG